MPMPNLDKKNCWPDSSAFGLKKNLISRTIVFGFYSQQKLKTTPRISLLLQETTGVFKWGKQILGVLSNMIEQPMKEMKAGVSEDSASYTQISCVNQSLF